MKKVFISLLVLSSFAMAQRIELWDNFFKSFNAFKQQPTAGTLHALWNAYDTLKQESERTIGPELAKFKARQPAKTVEKLWVEKANTMLAELYNPKNKELYDLFAPGYEQRFNKKEIAPQKGLSDIDALFEDIEEAKRWVAHEKAQLEEIERLKKEIDRLQQENKELQQKNNTHQREKPQPPALVNRTQLLPKQKQISLAKQKRTKSYPVVRA